MRTIPYILLRKHIPRNHTSTRPLLSFAWIRRIFFPVMTRREVLFWARKEARPAGARTKPSGERHDNEHTGVIQFPAVSRLQSRTGKGVSHGVRLRERGCGLYRATRFRDRTTRPTWFQLRRPHFGDPIPRLRYGNARRTRPRCRHPCARNPFSP